MAVVSWVLAAVLILAALCLAYGYPDGSDLDDALVRSTAASRWPAISRDGFCISRRCRVGRGTLPNLASRPTSPSMCNLYSMTRTPEAVRRLFRVQHNRASAFEPQNAIFPGYQAPIIRNAADGERELVNATWGFVLLQPGKAPRRVAM